MHQDKAGMQIIKTVVVNGLLLKAILLKKLAGMVRDLLDNTDSE